MKKYWEFFDELNEFVYVSDIDSHELVYMNKKTMQKYGFSSREEYVGKKCYEVLQGYNTPCAICVNNELVSGAFKEWRYYNLKLDKHLMIKDTMIEENGRRCRFELAIDVTSLEQQKTVIRDFQNLEAYVNEGIRLALQAPDPDKTIDIILEYLGSALNGERTYIFEKNAEDGDDNTYEWVARGVTPQKENLQNVPSEVCADWYRNFSENKTILIEDLETIREEDPVLYEVLNRQSIHSIVVVPLYDDKKVIGFYGVDNPPIHNMDYAKNMLQIMGHFIISTLKRRDLMRQLQKMSYCDQLTGIGNRHAMSEFIAGISSGSCIGVVYCDVTGLKRVNDSEGHEAGDRLICRACDCLKSVFGEYGLFRIGGDELLALCVGIDKNTLDEMISQLRTAMKENSVNMAVGYVWQENGADGVLKLLSDAEKRMYVDKSEYYKALGIDRR